MSFVILFAGNLEYKFLFHYDFVCWVCVNVYEGMTAQTGKKAYANTNTMIIVCMFLTIKMFSTNFL